MKNIKWYDAIGVFAVFSFVFFFYIFFGAEASIIPVSSTPNFTADSASSWGWNDNDSTKNTHAGIVWEWPTAYRLESVTFQACRDTPTPSLQFSGVYVGASTTPLSDRDDLPLVTYANVTTPASTTPLCTSGTFSDFTYTLERPVTVQKGEKVFFLACNETDSETNMRCSGPTPRPRNDGMRYQAGTKNFNNHFYGFCYSFFCGYGNIYEFSSTTYSFQPSFIVGGSSFSLDPGAITLECSITDPGACIANALAWAFTPPEDIMEGFGSLAEIVKKKPPFGYFTQATEAIRLLASSSSSTIQVTIPEILKTSIFDPIRAMILVLFSLFALFSLYNRLKNVIV